MALLMNLAATFSGIALAMSATFGGPYVAGQVIDQVGAVFDDGGSIADPGAAVVRDCMVQVDIADEDMRRDEGYAEGEARFLILAATLTGDVDTDATVQVLGGPNAGTWLVGAIERDSFGIYWQGRGRRAPEGEQP
jgi:hypothetical protein